MRIRQVLFSTVAAIGIAAMAATVPDPARAQQAGGRHRQGRHRRRGAPARAGRKPASGSSPRRPSCRPSIAKIVVTDDQGRYVIPDLPTANYQVWVRGYGLVDSPKMRGEARPAARSHGGAGARRALGGAVLPGDLLVRDDEDAAGQGFRRLDRHPEGHHARALAPAHGQCRLRRLPSARAGIDAHHPGAARRVQVGRGGVDAPRRLRPYRRVHGEPPRRTARRRAVQVFRRVDRPRRQGRAAEAQAGAAARRRAQRRRHVMGVGHREDLRPRPDLVRPAQSDRQRLRSALRLARVLERRHPDPRSEDAQGDVLQDDHARSERAGIVRAAVPCDRDARSRRCPRPTGATRRSGASAPTTTTACSTGRAACGSRRRCAAPTTRPSARRARTIPRPRSSRSSGRDARCRCSIRRR